MTTRHGDFNIEAESSNIKTLVVMKVQKNWLSLLHTWSFLVSSLL